MKNFLACHLPSFSLLRFVIFMLRSRSKAMKIFRLALCRLLRSVLFMPGSKSEGVKIFCLVFLRVLRFAIFMLGSRSKALKNFSSCSSLDSSLPHFHVEQQGGEALKKFSSFDPFDFFALLSLDSLLHHDASSSSHRIKSAKAVFRFTQSQLFS